MNREIFKKTKVIKKKHTPKLFVRKHQQDWWSPRLNKEKRKRAKLSVSRMKQWAPLKILQRLKVLGNIGTTLCQ